ncbi:MAG: hypothetical protein K2Y20_15865 [Sphingomonas sp.]|nr:hypothetical protein [Sphingobium sp.]MBX9861046.1 hypothetical protein [Sphingomonas sp.]
MLSLGEIDALERSLKASIVGLNKKRTTAVTLIEAVDQAMLWPEPFDDMVPIASSHSLDNLISRAPLLICAVAAEIGFRFEGVGTVFWAKFSDALGLAVTMAQRQRIAEIFETQAKRYDLSRPSDSAFSSHFSIIAWPIANALLPVDLVGAVSRLMARAPVAALPGPGRATNFSSLRAWASAAEGARLTDWLRLEAPSGRVLSALLTENRGTLLSSVTYTRLRDAVATNPEAFFAARAARLRGRSAKPPTVTQQTLGRIALLADGSGVHLFVSWPPLPPALYDEARGIARSAGWKPRLWNAGSFLHPDTALGTGPFAITLGSAPGEEDAAYADAASVFGAGTDIAATLASRTIDWTATLLFDVNADRSQAEQRFGVLNDVSGYAWLGRRIDTAPLVGLKQLGTAGGYRFYEANLADGADRAILIKEDLLANQRRALLARHPIDAISAPQGVVRPDRPFLIYSDSTDTECDAMPQRLPMNGRIAAVSGLAGRPGLRAEAAPIAEDGVADIIVFERDSAFEALVERRLQLRVESSVPLIGLSVTADLEIDGRLIARGRERLATLPTTIASNSKLLTALYDDAVRAKLLEAGKGMLRLALGRSRALTIPLERPAASVEWTESGPQLIGADLSTTLVEASAQAPHRFVASDAIVQPSRGAKAYGLLLSDGRIADPLQVLSSNIFDYGDFTAQFGSDVGSRRMFDHGKGVCDIARARISWARARCTTLPAIGAKGRVVLHFEDPLVIDLCGRAWSLAEQGSKDSPTDPHASLWHIAVARGLATVPAEASPDEAALFARAFVQHARSLDPDWPIASTVPADGAMDDALNEAFSEAIVELHAAGALLDVENDFDFGAPPEDWESAAEEALRAIRRPALVRQLAPTEGGRLLAKRSYADLSIAELAEDLAAWTRNYALPRGQLSPETAAGALQLWLSPAACDDVEAAVHVLANDPFVSRATRYAALRLGPSVAGVSV